MISEDINDVVKEIRDELKSHELKLSEIKSAISDIKARYDMASLLIKWVVFPLIVILGGLAGAKILMPTL